MRDGTVPARLPAERCDDPHPAADKDSSMRIFMFTSATLADLHAFAGDETGTKLPQKYAPWGLTGVLAARQNPPHNFSRRTIEQALESTGFQLWRTKPKS